MTLVWAAGFLIALAWLGWNSLPDIKTGRDILPTCVVVVLFAALWPAVLTSIGVYYLILLCDHLFPRKD